MYVLLISLAVLYAGALLMLRRTTVGLTADVQYLAYRSDQREVARAEAMESLTCSLKFTDDVADARSSLNADAHREFYNRLDAIESRLDHTIKALSETYKGAKRAAKGR